MSDALTRQACERKFGVQECPLHPGNDVVCHCEECSVPVCVSCMTDQHRGHTFCKIDKLVGKRNNDVGQFLENANKLFIPNVSQSINEIGKKESKLKANKTSMLHGISKSFDTMYEQLQIARIKIEEKVNTLHEDQGEQLIKIKQKLVKLEKKLESKLIEINRIFDNGTLIQKYDVIQSLQKDEEEAKTLPEIPEIYTPKLCFDETIETLFQSFKNMTEQLSVKPPKHAQNISNSTSRKAKKEIKGLPIIPPKHQQTIVTSTSFDNKSRYDALTPVTEDKSWCGVNGYKKLCMINKQGSVEQELQTSVNIISLCLHPITGVLYGTFTDNTICTIDTTTGATTTVLTCPYRPDCLTVTPDGDIIVGELPGHVYRYSSNGQLLHQSKEEYDVYDISYSDINDHVAITCGYGVTIMDGTLTNVIHTHKLVCRTAVYDRDGSLLIGDRNNKSIHILDGKTFSTIRTFTPPQMSKPENIRLYNNSMWVECYNPRKIIHVMFQ